MRFLAYRALARSRTAPLLGIAGRLFTHSPQHLRDVLPADPAGELAGVLVAQRDVLDPRDDRNGLAQRGHSPLGGVQIVVAQQRLDGELEHRDPPRDQVAHGRLTLVLAQLARILTIGRDGDEGLPGDGLLPLERLHRSGLPGRVTVEGVDHLAAVVGVVHHQAPDQCEVVVAEGRATAGDGGRDARQVHRHDIGVALDDDDLMPLGDVLLRMIEAEQHLRLLVEHGLGRVHVLAEIVVVEELARTEADDIPAQVLDRP